MTRPLLAAYASVAMQGVLLDGRGCVVQSGNELGPRQFGKPARHGYEQLSLGRACADEAGDGSGS